MSRAVGRWVLWVSAAAMVAGLGGCADEPPAEEVADRLRIELGAEQEPIGALLKGARGKRGAEDENTPTPLVPKPGPPPPPPPRTRIVRLRAGETLGQLCARELGTSQRWREIQELNGWSDAQLRQLPEGQEVRLPVER